MKCKIRHLPNSHYWDVQIFDSSTNVLLSLDEKEMTQFIHEFENRKEQVEKIMEIDNAHEESI